jgi:RimJ/RimL family protein N-acetyltransferase
MPEVILSIPPLETERLLVRRFERTDLDDLHTILDRQLGDELSRADRRTWLEWSLLNYDALEQLYQPPFGDRAVVEKDSGRVVGACGLAPVLYPPGLLPGPGGEPPPETPENYCTRIDLGLYYALSTEVRGRGYATEAARALLGFAFDGLRLCRVVANTNYDNLPSQRVMQRLGMRLYRNAFDQPEWFQVLGILERGER